jgi:ParB-like chromosome segregation protein Spo0J
MKARAQQPKKHVRHREGLQWLPTKVVARYADPFIDPSHRVERARMRRLTRSIARRGVIEPLIIKVQRGRARIFDGNHRLAVALRLGIPVLPVDVRHG